jgi:hypothetical protein
MEEPTLFVYEPLPAGHIRLLTPASDEVADSHSWKVQTSSLDQSDLEFDALSYVWGSDLERLDITLNGCTAQVYRNLYTALPYLARRGNLRPVRPIWIDAICINQADHEEKMMQIREMNRVYKQAKRVWIWLGISQHQESIPDAIRFLGNIAEYKKSHRHEKFDDMKKRLDLETVQIPLKVALHHIVHNEWFNRLWVIQEASLAQEPSFLCGDIECSWELLYNSLKNMRLWDFLVNEFRRCENLSGLCDHDLKDGTRKSNARGRIFFIRNVVKIHWNGENHKTAYSQAYMLALTLNMSWAHECLRPEDRVLGLLGLVDPKFLERSCLDPDIAYISVEDLFTRTTRFVLEAAVQSDKFLWEWLRCAFALHKRKGLPSWVLDFCSLWHPGFGHIEPDDSILSRYTAVKNHRITRGGLKTEQLVLKGKVVDEVMMVFRMMPSSDAIEHMSQPTKRAYLSTVAEWEKKVADEVLGRTSTCTEILPREGVEDYGMPESYWRTLINHRKCTQGEVPADDETITRDWYLDFQSMAKQLRGIATCLLTKQYASNVCIDTYYCAHKI